MSSITYRKTIATSLKQMLNESVNVVQQIKTVEENLIHACDRLPICGAAASQSKRGVSRKKRLSDTALSRSST